MTLKLTQAEKASEAFRDFGITMRLMGYSQHAIESGMIVALGEVLTKDSPEALETALKVLRSYVNTHRR